jgi:V8-like Glu-specific endopeptidase
MRRLSLNLLLVLTAFSGTTAHSQVAAPAAGAVFVSPDIHLTLTSPPGVTLGTLDKASKGQFSTQLGQVVGIDRSSAAKIVKGLSANQSITISLSPALTHDDLVTKAHTLQAQRSIVDRIINNQFPPLALKNGIVTPMGTQKNPTIAGVLSPTVLAHLQTIARSVGRIQARQDTTTAFDAIATGFVVAPGVVATNCHVVTDLANDPPSDMLLRYPDNTFINFDDSQVDSPSHEFKVTGVLAWPNQLGVDVALLKVETTSLDGSSNLPAPLRLDAPATGEQAIAVIGFPSPPNQLTNGQDASVVQSFQSIAQVDGIAFSPGLIMSQPRPDGVELIEYSASTRPRESGSPLVSLTSFNVIGVHFCCEEIGSLVQLPLPCASTIYTDATANEAISVAAVLKDPALSVVFHPGSALASERSNNSLALYRFAESANGISQSNRVPKVSILRPVSDSLRSSGLHESAVGSNF